MPKPAGGHGLDPKRALDWFFSAFKTGVNAGPLPPDFPESKDPDYRNGGSVNMQTWYCSGWYVWATLGAKSALDVARERLLRLMALNRKAYQRREILTTSHGQMDPASLAVALNRANRLGDGDVIRELTWWFGVLYCLCEMNDSNGEPWTGGGRGFVGGKPYGLNDARTRAYQTIHAEHGLPGKKSDYYLGAQALAVLNPSLLHDIKLAAVGAISAFPPVLGGMRCHRWDDDNFFMVIGEKDPAALRGADWVRCSGERNGERWISAEIDHEKLASYDELGPPAKTLIAPASTLLLPGTKDAPEDD